MRVASLIRLLLVAFAAIISVQYALGATPVEGSQLALVLVSVGISLVQTCAAFKSVAAYATVMVFVAIVFVSYQMPAWSLASDSQNFRTRYSIYPDPYFWDQAMILVLLAQLGVMLVGMVSGAGFIRHSDLVMKPFEPPSFGTAKGQIATMLLLLLPVWGISLASGYARGATSSGPLAYLVLFVSPLILAGVASSVVLRDRLQANGVWWLAVVALFAVPTWEILNGKRGGLTVVMLAFFVVWMVLRGPAARVSGRIVVTGAALVLVVLPITTWVATNFREEPGITEQQESVSLAAGLNFIGDRAGAFESAVAVLSFEDSDKLSGIESPSIATVTLGVAQQTLPAALDVVDSEAVDGLGVRYSAQYLGNPAGNAGAWGGIGLSYAMLGVWGMALPGLSVGLCILILRRLCQVSVVGIGLTVSTVYALVWGFMVSGNMDAILAGWLRTGAFYVVLAGIVEALRRQRERLSEPAPRPPQMSEAPHSG